MNIIATPFDDLFVMEYASFKDHRGEFVKTIHKETFIEKGLDCQFMESFYSLSNENVIRGMHFQTAPHDHNKLVYVVTGKILDVVVDLRNNSKTFGEFFQIELTEENRKGIYIGKGFAHGFLSLRDNTIVEYHTSTSQDRDHESGIRYNSFGFDWEIEKPILSNRDQRFDFFNKSHKYFL